METQSFCVTFCLFHLFLFKMYPNTFDPILKRVFDICFSFVGLFFLWPIILISWVVASINTIDNGFFVQVRIGRYGRTFKVLKIRTMKSGVCGSPVTVDCDHRITICGRFMRHLKIDELPQLINILIGDMSFVGPRPDVTGFADKLQGEDKRMLLLKPGITGPATIKYRHEELLLSRQYDPIKYNREVIWPDKVALNLRYLDNWSFAGDIRLILKTIFSR